MGLVVAAIKPSITIADLDKIDIRVGTILSVEEVRGADKLLKLTVALGNVHRSIVAGMKQERDNPQELVGKQALFVVNLEPRKMMGQTSEGMVFDIGYADGLVPVLAIPEAPIPDGTRAG